MQDNFKLEIIEKGLPRLMRELSWLKYSGQLDNEDSVEGYLLKLGYSQIEIDCADKLNKAYYAKLKRIKIRIRKMEELTLLIPSLKMLFLTFTFQNGVLEELSDKTKRVYVERFLREYTIKYIANVDYGKLNGRIHYHAVVVCRGKLDYTIWSKKLNYGALNGKLVDLTEEAPKRMAKYLNKLALHSIKESTQFQSIIYDRRDKEMTLNNLEKYQEKVDMYWKLLKDPNLENLGTYEIYLKKFNENLKLYLSEREKIVVFMEKTKINLIRKNDGLFER